MNVIERDQGVTMSEIARANILIMASSGFEQSELQMPLQELRERGATVHVAAPDRAPLRGWKGREWGISLTPDKTFDAVNCSEYDALLLPGSVTNLDSLRWNQQALRLIREFVEADKVVATICHVTWLLVEINALRGRKVTCSKAIKSDVVKIGAQWQDSAVVIDRGFITGRSAADLPGFIATLIEELQARVAARELRDAQLVAQSNRPPATLATASQSSMLKHVLWYVFAKYADRYRSNRYRITRTVDAQAR